MTPPVHGPDDGGGELNTGEILRLQFARAGMLHPGYDQADVDRFRTRMVEEVDRLAAENAELRSRLSAAQEELRSVVPREAPSDQAVRILAVAQQTADQYVAEAEDFSRQITTDARSQSEERLRLAREEAGAILQAAHEAAQRMVEERGLSAPETGEGGPSREELREQVAYLTAFGQAVRTQLRSYLEALITDVESEWGRAHPASLPQPQAVSRRPGNPSASGNQTPRNVVAEIPPVPTSSPGAASGKADPTG